MLYGYFTDSLHINLTDNPDKMKINIGIKLLPMKDKLCLQQYDELYDESIT